jgi:tetratricopeptide (TPR) repeat protein
MAIGGELIFGPALAPAGLLGALTVGADTVNVLEPVTVTARMEEKGLSSHVVTERLVTRIAQVADIDTEFHAVGAKDIAGEGFFETLAEAFHLEKVIVAARKLPGAIDVEFHPEFVEREAGTVLRLRTVRPRTGVRVVQEFEVEGDGFDHVLRQASRAILAVVDPVALAIDDMRHDDLASGRESLSRAAAAAEEGVRHVTDTLQGVMLLEEGELEGAVVKLRTALLREPGFAPARLALAIALARGDRDVEAGALLAGLERDGRAAGAAPAQAAAAAAFVRGRLAGGEGRWAEALPDLRAAVDAVPNFTAAHRALAEAYRALGMAPFAEYHARTAARLAAVDVPRFDDRLDDLLQVAVEPVESQG